MKREPKYRQVYVYACWLGIPQPTLMGILNAELLRGKEIFSFEYDDDWLRSTYAMTLDPDLSLYSGKHYLPDENKSNFGLFLDSSPDRWGRLLMRRREAALAIINTRPENNLLEVDYLLGVFDGHRMGGLRFKTEPDGPFLNDNKELASPPWSSIRELEQISLRLEDDEVINDPDYLKWLSMLVAPGSSLGGARPKSSIVDESGQLWIAKFPSKNDPEDMGAWEMVVHELAVASGLNMSEAQARKFSGNHHTFLTKRFDRTENGSRLHFASAMTLLGYTDGKDHHDGVSYLELVEFISNYGARVKDDLKELWRRIVFNICVSNTDDHLRNHGFILTSEGWILSPAYDLNPVESGTGLKLNISENDNALDLELALEVREFFRLTEKDALSIINDVKNSVNKWKLVASKYHISNSSQKQKTRAFNR